MRGTAKFKGLLWTLATRFKVLSRIQLPAWRRFILLHLHQLARPAGKLRDYGKHLVLLAWEFPPAVTGGVYRPTSLARYASQKGWEVTVVCGPAPGNCTAAGTYLAEGIPENVTVHHIAATPNGPHPAPLPHIDGGIGNAMGIYEKVSEIIAPLEPGVILASGPPFHSFVAGLWLAKRFGWKLVLDYRDEWSHNPFRFVMNDQTNERWEARCLKQADHVVFTTHSQLELQVKGFPSFTHDKGSVVFNGWEPRDFSNRSTTVNLEPLRQKKLSLAFFGNLGPMAHPAEFLNTLSEVYDQHPLFVDTTQVVFVGYKQPAVVEQLKTFPYPGNLLLLDQVSKAEAAVMMREVSALLLLNTPALFRYIQGKLYDYMASNTPILFYGEGGEMATVIEEQRAGLVIPYADPTALANGLVRLIKGDIKTAPNKTQWLQSRTREHQAERLLDTLGALIEPEHTSRRA